MKSQHINFLNHYYGLLWEQKICYEAKQYFVSTKWEKVEGKKAKLFSKSERNFKNILGLKKSKKQAYLFKGGTEER